MPTGRATQKDIARLAGVHRSTVSLALKNHPGISKETREQVARIAEELGYRPDPMLSALSAYRSSLRPQSFHGTLAWLVNAYTDYDWRVSPHYRDYFEGAKAQAERAGYTLEVFTIDSVTMPARRVASIMLARNIRGVLLCPQPKDHASMDFPWDNFASVSFGYTLSSPRLHTVTAAHYRAVRHCLGRFRASGCKRIGLAITKQHDMRVDNNYTSAFLGDSFAQGDVLIPPYLEGDFWENSPGFRTWLSTHKPDGLLTNHFGILGLMEKNGYSVPEEISVASASLPKADEKLSGVVEDSRHIGEVAVNLVIAMVQRGERGIPAQPQRIHVEGVWSSGRSMKPALVEKVRA